jgi:hypothetical protein
MITKNLIIAKDLCTYRIIFLHQEKILRDHAMSYRPGAPTPFRRNGQWYLCGGTPKPRSVPSKIPLTGRTEAPVLPLSAGAARGVEAAWQVVAGRLPAMTEVASR